MATWDDGLFLDGDGVASDFLESLELMMDKVGRGKGVGEPKKRDGVERGEDGRHGTRRIEE